MIVLGRDESAERPKNMYDIYFNTTPSGCRSNTILDAGLCDKKIDTTQKSGFSEARVFYLPVLLRYPKVSF